MYQGNSNQTGVGFSLFLKIALGITNGFVDPVILRPAVIFPSTRVRSLSFLTVVFSRVNYCFWYRV